MPDEPAPLRSTDAPPAGPLVPFLGRRAASLVARAGEPLYRLGISSRNRRFDRGDGVVSLPIPVISVGNLSVGGTGKTPLVLKLVAALLDAGRHPAIAMRGYTRSDRSSSSRAPGNRGTRFGASRGERSPADAAVGGEGGLHGHSDEADLYRRLLPGTPVVAQPDRTAGLRRLLASSPPGAIDAVVLDDGFQHRRLARDLDIVLLDASRNVFADRLLPAGWLREPVTSLQRAGVVVLTHAELVSDDQLAAQCAAVRRLSPHAQVCTARHVWTGLAAAHEPGGLLPLSWLTDKRLLAVCAIGNPAGFLSALVRQASSRPAQLVLPDHDPYSSRTLSRLLALARTSRAQAIITTEKDWSKLGTHAIDWPCPIVRPVLELQFVSGWDALMDRARRARSAPGTA